MGEEPFSKAGPVSGRSISSKGLSRIPSLVRPDSVNIELINSADTRKGTLVTGNGEEEYEHPEDSGGAAGSGGGNVREGDLSQREANGGESVVVDDSREAEVVESGEEEGREPKTMRAPKKVTKEERDAHEATHMPFRSWCRHCVRGRARNMQHHKGKEEEDKGNKIPRVSLDYFFMLYVGRRQKSEYQPFTYYD